MITYAVGAFVAGAISITVGMVFPAWKIPVLFVLLLLWLFGTISGFMQIDSDDRLRGVDVGKDGWDKSTLPIHFRFIDPETTLKEVVQRVGPYTRIRETGAVRAMQWDVPYGAVIIFPEDPNDADSKIMRVTVLAEHRIGNRGPTPWFHYTYDVNGNVTKRQNVRQGMDATNVEYDSLDRPTKCVQTGANDVAFATGIEDRGQSTYLDRKSD